MKICSIKQIQNLQVKIDKTDLNFKENGLYALNTFTGLLMNKTTLLVFVSNINNKLQNKKQQA